MAVTQNEVDEAVATVFADAGAGSGPDTLEREAQALAAAAAVATPAKLFLEAADKRARARVLRARSLAVEAVQQASGRVAECEAAYEATAEPEAVCAARAFEALQLLQQRHHERTKASDELAPVAEIDRLIGLIGTAEETVAGEEARVTEATRAREEAYAALEAARAYRREARRDALGQIEASLENPLAAALPPEEVRDSLMWCWPWRVMRAKTRLEPPLSPAEEAACRELAGMFADLLGVVPADAESRVRADERAKVTAAMRQVDIVLPDGRTANLGQLARVPAGPAGR